MRLAGIDLHALRALFDGHYMARKGYDRDLETRSPNNPSSTSQGQLI
jgi:hypothetical protein